MGKWGKVCWYEQARELTGLLVLYTPMILLLRGQPAQRDSRKFRSNGRRVRTGVGPIFWKGLMCHGAKSKL